jgi:hypothetical protein
LAGSRLIDCLLQYPASDLSREIFSTFFNHVTQQRTFRLEEDLSPLTTCLDLKHVQLDAADGPQPSTAGDCLPEGASEEVEDCLDVKIKINFERY